MIRSINSHDKEYPSKLKFHLRDCKKLYYKGDLSLANMKTVGVVGSRKAGEYGLKVADEIAKLCAKNNICIVSGLARGIDGAAHKGALKYGGKTVGVLGNGIDVYYPKVNSSIQDEIGKRGLLISEYPCEAKPRAYQFPQRNRIIAALSDLVIMVQGETRSGAAITVEQACDMGKRVFAVPGNINNPLSQGTNKLIADGVTPLVRVVDILEEFQMSTFSVDSSLYEELGNDEKMIMDIIMECGEITIEKLNRETTVKPSVLYGIITVLEMKGLVFVECGNICLAKF